MPVEVATPVDPALPALLRGRDERRENAAEPVTTPTTPTTSPKTSRALSIRPRSPVIPAEDDSHQMKGDWSVPGGWRRRPGCPGLGRGLRPQLFGNSTAGRPVY